ncbi:MAG: hypothetical protein ACRDPY_08850 [Streptosporangiaceae bacterium]
MTTISESPQTVAKGPLEGRVALVTGGTRGIGAAISSRLTADGPEIAAGYWRGAEAASPPTAPSLPNPSWPAQPRRARPIALPASIACCIHQAFCLTSQPMLGKVSNEANKEADIMAASPAQQIQDEILNTIRKSQETVIDAIQTWVETVQSITPKIPSVQVPLADKLPKPEDVVAGAYDFAEKLLAGQRRFAEEVLRATSALTPGNGSSHSDSE